MHYVDGDLGEYHEYGTNVMVNPPGSTASGLARPAVGRRLHPSPARRPGVHLGGGTDDLGLSEGDGGLHGARRRVSSASTSASTASSRSAWNSGPVCRCRRHSPPASRCTPPTRIVDGVTRETPGEMSLSGVRYRPGGVRRAARRSPVRQGTRVARLAETRAGLEFGRNVEMTFGDAQEICMTTILHDEAGRRPDRRQLLRRRRRPRSLPMDARQPAGVP